MNAPQVIVTAYFGDLQPMLPVLEAAGLPLTSRQYRQLLEAASEALSTGGTVEFDLGSDVTGRIA